MLELVERYLDRTKSARTDPDIIGILADVASVMGFNSAYLIEYPGKFRPTIHVLDTKPGREAWWREYLSSGMRTAQTNIAELLAKGGVQRFNGLHYTSENDPILILSRKYDMLDAALVPISYGGEVVGLAGFTGKPDLTPQKEMALQVLAYSLFAQLRSFSNSGVVAASSELTPREKQVMRLAADGLTSQDIADRLGMSSRTVNQHVDNVANKLGTKNRTHTVVEVIRRDMLD